MASETEQIRAILSWNTFRWAFANLPTDRTIDDVRFRDLITVSEEDVYAYVLEHGFPERVVLEGDAARFADDALSIAPLADGRWSVYYTERGRKSDLREFDSLAEARRDVVRQLMESARISLNHRYKLAHPEEDLPLPSEMD